MGTNSVLKVSSSKLRGTYNPPEPEPEPKTTYNAQLKISDTSKTNEETMKNLGDLLGQEVHDKPSYSMDLDGEIEEDDMEDYANEILSSLDTNIDITNMVVTTDTVNDTLTMTSPNGDKIVVSTEDGK